MYVVSIENDKVVISRGIISRGYDSTQLTTITSVEDYYKYFEDEANRIGCSVEHLTVYNSSTMDYPEDSTSDPDTLALVRTLNNLSGIS